MDNIDKSSSKSQDKEVGEYYSLSVDDRIKILANIIVDKLIEKKQIKSL